jgi:LacI family transcriptional regulator
MKKMTIDRVAELAYVSRSVVSRVINDHPNVSDEARERVMQVIEEHDYRPSSVARSLATDRTFEICVLTPRRQGDALANGFWPLLHSGIFEQCVDRGYLVSMSMVSPEIGEEINDRLLNDERFDGYILITKEVTGGVIPALRERGVPTVLIGHDPDHDDLHSVDVNNYEGAYTATEHLCSLGHETIGALWGNPELKETKDRRAGYRQALADAGREVPEAWNATGDYSQRSGREILRDWIDRGLEPSALFCASDTMATGALLALAQAGINVPDDVAVVGFDGLPTSRYTIPPLTTVAQPIYEKGERAADIIVDQIESEGGETVHLNLGAELIVRESCGADPADRDEGPQADPSVQGD